MSIVLEPDDLPPCSDCGVPAADGLCGKCCEKPIHRDPGGSRPARTTRQLFQAVLEADADGLCTCPYDRPIGETTCRRCAVIDCPESSPEHYAGDTCTACGWVRWPAGCEHAEPTGPDVCDDCAAADARETERDLEADAREELRRG